MEEWGTSIRSKYVMQQNSAPLHGPFKGVDFESV
jgi:hypothetical protein